MWGKSGSQVMIKNAVGQSDSVFSCQYLINGLTSHSDFFRHEIQ